MMFNQITQRHRQIWVLLRLILVIFVISACGSTGFTRKQREALDHYVDQTADAIHFSATKVKTLLSEYNSQNGSWPKGEDRRKLFRQIGEELFQHKISKQKLLEVDSKEVIVEYSISAAQFKQIPQLLESWVIVFSNGQNRELDIVSIYPHWCDIKESMNSPYPAAQVEQLRAKFQQLLQEKLSGYSITLNEHLSEKS